MKNLFSIIRYIGALMLFITFGLKISAQEIKIGTQIWAKVNLSVTSFRNGDAIQEVTSIDDWETACDNKEPAWCYFSNDPANGKRYGKLYNWYAVNDSRGLAPIGWHIPSDAEWTILGNNLGGNNVAGKKMKSTSGWVNDGNGTNSSGFTGFAGGYRALDGAFVSIGTGGNWWSSTEYPSEFKFNDSAGGRLLGYGTNSLNPFRFNKHSGLSVRCVKN